MKHSVATELNLRSTDQIATSCLFKLRLVLFAYKGTCVFTRAPDES